MKLITPKEVTELKQKAIPDVVIESVNELILKKWDGSSSSFKQDDLVKLIMSKNKDKKLTRNRLYDEHFLDFEPIYRKQGWKVVYDKPAYNESYPATFTFSK